MLIDESRWRQSADYECVCIYIFSVTCNIAISQLRLERYIFDITMSRRTWIGNQPNRRLQARPQLFQPLGPSIYMYSPTVHIEIARQRVSELSDGRPRCSEL